MRCSVHFRPAAAAVLALTTATASCGHAAPQVWTQDWEIKTHPVVHVRVDDARVRVHSGPAGRIATRVEYDLKRWGVVLGIRTPTVLFERKGDEMWIQARDPRGVSVIGGIDERFTVDVTVPPEVTLMVRSGDGAVDVLAPLSGRFEIETGDGAVQATGLRGEVVIVTGDGRVIVEDMQGGLRVRTRDGRIKADGRFEAVDVSSRDGSVQVSADRGSRVSRPWLVESHDGRVDLRIPHDVAALLDVRTRDGRIRVDLPIGAAGDDRGRNMLVGELNGGGPPLRVRTQDGGILLALSD
jgi:hypothetical protein